jgi:propanediol utilization protein
MSTDRLTRILEQVKALSPDDRRRLVERLENDEELSTLKSPVRRAGTLKGTVKYMAPDFDAPLDDFKEYME